MSGRYSILDQFEGAAVLLTGATGYVGALVLEKLLRCTNISKCYVLLREKRGEHVDGRLRTMLRKSPVLHLLRDNEVLSKVQAVAGDMTAVNLGISEHDKQLLRREVHTVIHCAADIRLEASIDQLLQANYEGTQELLELAKSFDNLQAFVHVSSAYTNMNATPGSLVHESIYRLAYGDQLVDHQELVQELLSMPPHNAELRAEGLLAHWNFPNNYTLSKHLAEYMVADYQKHFNMPVSIVRPTLISAVARDPYPGYTGNYAGHVGATLAFMAGLFDSPAASNYKGSNVWDVIPSDVVANVILAAAAALGQGSASRCSVSPVFQKSPWGSGPAALEQQSTTRDSLLIVHCGSSTTYPLTIMESWNWGVEVYGAWPMAPNLVGGRFAGPLNRSHEPNPSRAAYHIWLTGWKIWLAAQLLTFMKKERVARKLTMGFEAFRVINQPKTDVNLRFSTTNMQVLASLLEPAEREQFLLLWKPQLLSSPPVAVSAEVLAGSPVDMAGVKGDLLALDSSSRCMGSEGSTIHTAPTPAAVITRNCSSSSYSDTDSRSGGDESCSSLSSIASLTAPRRCGAVLTNEQQQEVAKMRSARVDWRSFHITLGAFLYCTLFRKPVPPATVPITNPQVKRWLNIQPQHQFIQHQFKQYK